MTSDIRKHPVLICTPFLTFAKKKRIKEAFMSVFANEEILEGF